MALEFDIKYSSLKIDYVSEHGAIANTGNLNAVELYGDRRLYFYCFDGFSGNGILTRWFTSVTSLKITIPMKRTSGSGTSKFDFYLYYCDPNDYDHGAGSSGTPENYIRKATVNKTFSDTSTYINVVFDISDLYISPDKYKDICVCMICKNTSSFKYVVKHKEAIVTADGSVVPAYINHTPDSGIKTGDNVTFSISNRGGRGITLRLKSGNTVLKTAYIASNATDTVNIVCEEGWFTAAGVSGTSMQISVDIEEIPNATDAFTLSKLIPTLSVSPISLNVGSNVTVTIGKRGGRTLSMKFKNGSTTLKTVSVTSDTVTVSCPRSWFTTAGVTALSMTVTVAIEAYGVSSSFTLNEIIPTLTLTPTTANTGDSLTIKIGKRDGRTLTLRLKYGNTQLTTVTGNADSVSVTCNKSWFTTANVAQASSMTVSVTIDGFSTTASFTLKAGTDMKPSVGTVTTTPVQQGPAATSFPNVYLKTITKVKFAVAVTKGSNSNISGVTVTLTGKSAVSLSYNSSTQKYEGALGPVTDAGYTITVTDARGFTGTKTGNIGTVYPYTQPAITVDQNYTYRCNSSGTKTPGGSYYRAKAKATIYTGLSGNGIAVFTVKLSGTSSTVNLTSDTQSAAKQTSVASGEKMDLVFTLKDTVGYIVEKTITLAPGGTWVDIREWSGTSESGDAGTSIGLGLAHQAKAGLNCIDILCQNNGQSYAGEAGYLLNGMSAIAFHGLIGSETDGSSFGKNFRNINSQGYLDRANATAYFVKNSSDSAWSGQPSQLVGSIWRGIRFVFPCGPATVVTVLEIYPSPGRIWTTSYDVSGNSWTAWKSITPA